MKTKEKYTEWRNKRLQEGLCPECGKEREDSTKRLCKKCRDAHAQYMREYKNNPDVRAKHRVRVAQWQRDNPGKVAILGKASRQRLKEDVFNHYGRKCACCRESHIEFLTIDHMNNDGGKQRRKIFGRNHGINIYAWIRQNGYPDDLQILCWNCNQAKYFYGICPHKSQSLFSCQQCGFASNADLVGATNISRRAPVNAPIVSPAPGGVG